MKKLLSALLAGACLFCAVSFAACGETKPNGETAHTHQWSSTYTEEGDRHYQICDGCKEKKYGNHDYGKNGVCVCGKHEPEAGVPVTGVTLNKEELTLKVGGSEMLTAEIAPENAAEKTVRWSSDKTEIATVDDNGLVTAVAKGTATITAAAGGKSATCSVTVNPAEELAFQLNDDGNGYTVTGSGTCRDTHIVIPAEYNGKPVTAIGEMAFLNRSWVVSISIPDSVTSIGDLAFHTTGLVSVTVPDSVASLGEAAFYGCGSLVSVTIGKGVTEIKSQVFGGCSKLTDIYYKGTEEEWSEIDISGNRNEILLKIIADGLYFYSETEQSGCWHYVDNVPVKW